MGLARIFVNSVRTGKATMDATLKEAAAFQHAGGILDSNKTIKEVFKRGYNSFSQSLNHGLTERMENMESISGKQLFKQTPAGQGSSSNLPGVIGNPGNARKYSKWQMAKSFVYDGDTGVVSKSRIAGLAAGIGAGAYMVSPSDDRK